VTICYHCVGVSQTACKLEGAAVRALQSCSPLPSAPGTFGRLLVFLDGFDELQAEDSPEATEDARRRLVDLYTTLCGGKDLVWSSTVLRVVVTSRESRLSGRGDQNAVFGAHRRRVLLPFRSSQVRSWVVVHG
jgi:hypothetical protein